MEDGMDDAPDSRRSLAWRIFFDASTRLQGILEVKLKKEAGITLADYNILLTLFEAPDHQMRMGELADRVTFSPSRLTYLVSRLVKDQLVEKLPSDVDGRGFIARLTPEGIQRTGASTVIHQETVRKLLLDDLTDAEIDRIVDAFERVDEQYRSD